MRPWPVAPRGNRLRDGEAVVLLKTGDMRERHGRWDGTGEGTCTFFARIGHRGTDDSAGAGEP